jgi:hypothetical protein
MCHSRGRGLLLAILAAMSILDCVDAGAQTGAAEQNPATSFAGLPIAGHHAFIGQGRPIRIVKN